MWYHFYILDTTVLSLRVGLLQTLQVYTNGKYEFGHVEPDSTRESHFARLF